MLWWRVAAKPDRRLLAAGAGIAFAILLPVAGTLVLQGLEPDVDGDWMAYRADGEPLDRARGTVRSLWIGQEDGVAVGAFVEGPPVVAVDQAMAPPGAALPAGLRDRVLAPQSVPLLPPGHVLVHPDTVAADRPHLLLLSRHVEVPGVIVVPARGADAFEEAGLRGLQGQTSLLVAASVPAVALVAAAFGDAEARRRARTAATLAALGRPRLGRWLLALRVALTAALGIGLATLMGYGLWRFGGGTFHPADAKPAAIAVAILVPGVLGGAVGIAWGMRRLGSGEAMLRTPPAETDLPGRRLAWLPTPARPLALGTRLLPILALAALLFAVDIGFPIAAAGVPAAVAGQPGEWVVGAQTGIVLGGQTRAAPADVMAMDPAIDAIVAEILVPTLVDGQAAILRGGELDRLASYHDLRVHGEQGLVLGNRLARHLDAGVGDVVAVQAADRPAVLWLQVTGTFDGGGLLQDEGLLDTQTARGLAGLAAGQATLLRMRPDDLAARDALGRSEARVDVVAMRIVPESPTAGDVARVEVDAVVLSSNPAARSLPVRVNGVVVAHIDVALPAYGHGVFSAPFVVPSGPFQVEVNPTATVQPGAAALHIQAPLVSFLPDAVPVTVREGPGDAAAGRVVDLLRDGAVVDTATTDAQGRATLQPDEEGVHTVRADGVHRTVRVGADGDRDKTVLRVESAWLTPDRPIVGSHAVWRAHVVNVGGAPGTGDVAFHRDDVLIATREADLLPGQSTVVEVSLVVSAAAMDLRAGNFSLQAVATPPQSPGSSGRDVDARTAGSIQVEVADRVLGDAQRALAGLGTIALAAILAIVYLATERTLDGRRHVVRVLHALGYSAEQIRFRAAWEAAAMAGIAFLGAAVAAKALFVTLGAIGWPRPFAHALPDPVSWLFGLQAGAAFAGAAALAGYLASARVLGARP